MPRDDDFDAGIVHVGHTIVLSRGLDRRAARRSQPGHHGGPRTEPRRARPSHGLHFAFFDQLLVDDKDTFRHFGFARTPDEENAANAKAIKLLNNSPYKNQLGNAGLFLSALDARQKEIPNLVSPHLGNRVPVIGDLKSSTPVDQKQNPQMIAALPIGGRVKLDPWNDTLTDQEQASGHGRRTREDAVRGDAVHAVPDAFRCGCRQSRSRPALPRQLTRRPPTRLTNQTTSRF